MSLPRLLLLLAFTLPAAAQEIWHFDQTAALNGHPTHVLGHPQVIATPYGKAVTFNGKDDALFVDVHPLQGLKTWTWEMIFRPDADGAAEQRIFHLQAQDPAAAPDAPKDSTDRLLFEIRIVKGQWCLDSAAFSGSAKATLLNCEKLYPLGEWARVTATYDGTMLRNYVGDDLQGEVAIKLAPQGPGHASMGVRINRLYWFKGAILEARFSDRALPVEQFLKFPAPR